MLLHRIHHLGQHTHIKKTSACMLPIYYYKIANFSFKYYFHGNFCRSSFNHNQATAYMRKLNRNGVCLAKCSHAFFFPIYFKSRRRDLNSGLKTPKNAFNQCKLECLPMRPNVYGTSGPGLGGVSDQNFLLKRPLPCSQ